MKKLLSSLGVLLFGVCAFVMPATVLRAQTTSAPLKLQHYRWFPALRFFFASLLCVKELLSQKGISRKDAKAQRRKAKPGDYATPLRP